MADAASSRDVDPPSGKRLRNLDPGPLSIEPEMETHAHVMELVILLTSLEYAWRGRSDYFASGNLSIFYSVASPRTGRAVRRKLEFCGPDFFVVLDPIKKPTRNSWVVQNEGGKYPNVIVEVLSNRTRKNDRGKKKSIYEQVFKTPEYFLFDPAKSTLEGYRLAQGHYETIAPDASGHLPSEQLGLALGLVDMPPLGRKMARLFTLKGELVPLPPEAAEREEARAKREEARAKREAARARREAARADRAERDRERLAAKLRELGVDPDRLD